MPPASRNQRVPTGGDTPAPIAASSLDRPAAINAQKRSRSSRRAIPGRPGDLNLSRNARSDRRLPAIATFLPVVLRRPVDSAIYAPNEWSTGKWVSEMAGNTTIVKEDVTESGTRYGPLRNVSRTYHQVSRPLVTP